jgi:HSP20 family molecular chaperone IbpA
VKFEESKIDRVSGEKVLFSWWITDDMPVMRNNVELFDERDRIVIVADLPDARLPNRIAASVNYKNGVLEVVIKKEGEYEG